MSLEKKKCFRSRQSLRKSKTVSWFKYLNLLFIQTTCKFIAVIDVCKQLKAQQWRNVTIWCLPADFFCRPHKFFTVSKKKTKNIKKGRHFFFGFSYRLLAPPPPPGAFCTPKYFFRVDRKLSWPRYGPFCCLVEQFFV